MDATRAALLPPFDIDATSPDKVYDIHRCKLYLHLLMNIICKALILELFL